jgi:hypothetical protein
VKRSSFEALISPSQAVKDGTKAKLALFSSKEVSNKYEVLLDSFYITKTISEYKYLMLLMTAE